MTGTMPRAFVFPGQGSQAVGMGGEVLAAFAAARHTLEEVDDALGQNLTRLIAEGPEDRLTLTENAQPALMAVSLAVLRVLEREAELPLGRICRFVAGHSLGEYSALAAAGALDVADAARLLRARGKAMQDAVPVGTGAMLALIGADLDQAREIADAAAEDEICDLANDNAPGQVVLSGDRAAIERAAGIARERGVRRAIPLPVSAPFHCRLLRPASDVMAEALRETSLSRPAVPLVANVTAAVTDDPDEIRGLLVEQVTCMVRWRESVLAMRDAGVDTLVEIGVGKVLSGMTRRIDPELTGFAIGTPDEIESFVKRV